MSQLTKDEINFEMRLFQVLAWTAIIANTLGYISDAAFYGLNAETIFTFFCALIMYVASAAGMILHKPRIPIFIILFICNLVEFPVMYAIYGGDRIGYLILGVVGVSLFLKDKKRVAGVSVLITLDSIIILWRQLNPDMAFMNQQGDGIVAAVIDFVIAGTSIAVMLIMLITQYEMQQKKLKELTVELQEMANLDPLTQLYNRRYLTEYLDHKIQHDETEFAVALLDIDDFKAVNDHYGHTYGDRTLEEFARIMKKEIKGKGIAARFGGEEFMLVFDQADKDMIDRILNCIETKFERFGIESQGIELSFSGGVEIFHNEDRITKLFNAADEKLYRAKNMGKRKIIYDRENHVVRMDRRYQSHRNV